MRREFNLPEDDEGSIGALGLPWETVKEENRLWLILNDFPVPKGFNVSRVSVAIEIPPNYPSAGLDMAYFLPHLRRTDGQALRQTEHRQAIVGQQWQRWSRHYPWKADQHNLGTHIVLISRWLDAALGKN
jgi:hypothetical protein